jgi:hypothetical protein
MIFAVGPWHRQVDEELPMVAVATKSCPGLSSQVCRISWEGSGLGFIFLQAYRVGKSPEQIPLNPLESWFCGVEYRYA